MFRGRELAVYDRAIRFNFWVASVAAALVVAVTTAYYVLP